MKLDVYLNYPGTCEQAFHFYEQHLGGKITGMRRHEDQPGQANIPADWRKAILHARIEIGSTVLMGADIPGAEPMPSAYLTLRLDSAEEAERVYNLLSDGGQIFMKMEVCRRACTICASDRMGFDGRSPPGIPPERRVPDVPGSCASLCRTDRGDAALSVDSAH